LLPVEGAFSLALNLLRILQVDSPREEIPRGPGNPETVGLPEATLIPRFPDLLPLSHPRQLFRPHFHSRSVGGAGWFGSSTLSLLIYRSSNYFAERCGIFGQNEQAGKNISTDNRRSEIKTELSCYVTSCFIFGKGVGRFSSLHLEFLPTFIDDLERKILINFFKAATLFF